MAGSVTKVLGAAILLSSIAGGAHAAGLERGGYNWDLLFSDKRIDSEAGVTYVMPQRKIKNARDGMLVNGKTSVDETEDYAVPRFGFKLGITEEADCLASYGQPWGIHTNPGDDWVGANENIETKIKSDDYGLTCSYKFDAGKGKFRVLGGVSYQELSGFKERLVDPRAWAFGLDGTGKLDLEADGIGWRIGAAYEIPEIAFRASLIYNSAVDLDEITGTLDLRQVGQGIIPVYGDASMPQSVELKVQSGIAPDWLAFGSVKWTDWSVLDVIAFCPTATKGMASCNAQSLPFGVPGGVRITTLDLMFRDSWYVSAGVGHKFNDQWSGQAQISWDRGTNTGLTTQTDTWLLASGVSFTPNENTELRLGGAVGMLTSGSFGKTDCPLVEGCGTRVKYDFGNDFVGALSIAGKVRF
ncbi:MAG: OmpP1/FadL family transporter [Phyllobacterium sp.]